MVATPMTAGTRRCFAASLASFTLAACGGDEVVGTPVAATQDPPGAIQPVVEHDFGVIPHGERRAVELTIPVPQEGGPWLPVAFQRSCTCVRHTFVAVSPTGDRRVIAGDGRAEAGGSLLAQESLRLGLEVFTEEKEAADLPASWTPAQVVLQGPGPRLARHFVPLRFRFGVESPFELVPTAHLALDELPRPIRYERSLRIDRRGRDVKFGEPIAVEPVADGVLQRPSDVELRLDDDGKSAVLWVAVKPAEARPDGPVQFEVRIPTDRSDGYVLRIPVSGAVVGAIEVEPPKVFSFGRLDLAAPREMRLRLVDHDPSRPADFVVVGVTGNDGEDLAAQFEVVLEPVEGQPRQRIVSLRYLGRLTGARSFRGELRLAKAAGDPPVLRLPFVGFADR